jgi:hypothetical protein
MKTLMLLLVALCFSAAADDLAIQFKNPPADARPWVYWFWNNGNVTKAGITADLEAMQRAGVGGVIIMDVVERFAPPAGTADFMNPEWQDLFCFAVSEAHRLGLKINMTNGPGWCGSSGPWITPALSMQMLVETNVVVVGPRRFHRVLPRPFTGGRNHDGFNSTVNFEDYYDDVAVLAYPVPTNGPVAAKDVLMLTGQVQPDGTLDWKIPDGAWIIQRIGHTTTGASTRPPVKGGNGLECDKLSREAMDVHFTNMMGRLIAEVGSLAGDTLTATHIDSWEVGSQNWTPKFGAEFKGRRGYDLTLYLPDVIPPAGLPTNWVAGGKVENPVGDSEVAKRFRWDFNETAAELLAENYVGRLAQRAHEHGLRLTIEGYNLPFGDEATYTARADEPMTEFWATGALENETKGRQMASVAHIMGDPIVGAEAFTSSDTENWRFHPAVIKALGDFEFSQGVNRLVVHRYAHQPYLDRYPGVTMGPWGLHYERTQTWWNLSTAWHQYLSRCQYLLRQGRFVADLCYLRPQWPNQTYFKASPALPDGYKLDECSAEALIHEMTVEDGRLVTKTGMSYRVLVLPEGSETMTPELARTIRQLVKAGATVLGARPVASPSLADYPACDREVQEIAAEVWGDCDGKKVTEHVCGQGRVIWGPPIGDVLRELSTPPDFASNVKLNWIHRRVGTTDLYFVANPEAGAVEAECAFRVSDRQPELWNPETGECARLASFQSNDGSVSVPVRLEGVGSTFVVFRTSSAGLNPVLNVFGDGRPTVVGSHVPAFSVQRAVYGVPGDEARKRDVRARVEALVKQGENHFQVAQMAEGDDPAFGVVKTLRLEFTVDGRALQTVGQDQDWVTLFDLPSAPERRADFQYDAQGRLQLVAREPGRYELVTADGRIDTVVVTDRAVKQALTGPWQVKFSPHWGAPDSITLDTLGSLSESKTAGVKYFSGIATYQKAFRWTPPKGKGRAAYQTTLDLGDLAVMADVWLNGHDLGVLWKAPYSVDITGVLRAGKNHLEIRVANLWLNRMIGDAGLPAEKRLTWSTYEPFKADEPLPKSGLLGPVTIQALPWVPVP